MVRKSTQKKARSIAAKPQPASKSQASGKGTSKAVNNVWKAYSEPGKRLSKIRRFSRAGASFGDKIAATRQGAPTELAVSMFEHWGIEHKTAAAILGISQRSWARQRSSSKVLDAVASDRFVRVMDLFKHADAVFDTHEDAVEWFQAENPSLAGRQPVSILDTYAGVDAVNDVLGRIEYGVFA